VRESRTQLDHAPFELVVQTDVWARHWPVAALCLLLLGCTAGAAVAGLAHGRRMGQRMAEDMVALGPERQGRGRVFSSAEAQALAQWLARERSQGRALQDLLVDRERVQWDILRRLPEPVLVSQGGRVVQANEQALALFGVPLERLVGQASSEFLHPDDRARVMPLLEHLRSTPESSETLHTRIVRGDGQSQGLEVTLVRIERAEGALILSVLRPVGAPVPSD
jgi:PAS domain S-box-containing protein